MPWRLVPQAWFRRIQLVTLIVTALVGLSIAWTPLERNVSTLSVIESAMSADYWAYGLVAFSVIALAAELDMWARKHERWIHLVAFMHIFLCALTASYAAAAFWGVLFRVWWNFGAPAMGGLLAYLHYMYVRRRPNHHA